ncbi:MAG: Sua5/YciO/YrdC/YwlC family protein [Desulfurella sp.]|uniref:Sua5/YciO/YrdC/YwlC family protein n=1 Tax=Desulfurella sp. TaxID=1962857 RepID=UPI003D10B19C
MKTIVCKDTDSFKYLNSIKNGIVIYPADTIYGIGASVFNTYANKKIFKIKRRDLSNPLIVLCSLDFILKSAYVDEEALNLLNLGATLILKNKINLPFYVSKDGKTAYRLAFGPYIKKIVERFALTSTSVNISKKQPINNSKELIKHYFGIVDVIITGKTKNTASTIVDFENKLILREGDRAETIKNFLGGL